MSGNQPDSKVSLETSPSQSPSSSLTSSSHPDDLSGSSLPSPLFMLFNQLEQKDKTIANLKQQLDQVTFEKKKLEESNASLSQDKEFLQKKIVSFQEELQKVTAENADLKAKILSLDSLNSELVAHVNKLQEEIKSMRQELQIVKNELAAKSDHLEEKDNRLILRQIPFALKKHFYVMLFGEEEKQNAENAVHASFSDLFRGVDLNSQRFCDLNKIAKASGFDLAQQVGWINFNGACGKLRDFGNGVAHCDHINEAPVDQSISTIRATVNNLPSKDQTSTSNLVDLLEKLQKITKIDLF